MHNALVKYYAKTYKHTRYNKGLTFNKYDATVSIAAFFPWQLM